MPFLRWLDIELPYFMMPKILNFVDSLPKTADYKVQRSQLREGRARVTERVVVAKTGFKATGPFQEKKT